MATQKETAALAAKQKAKATKFVELAEKRATKAINSIRSLSKLANRSNYVYTEDQVKALGETLRKEVIDMVEHFGKTETAEKGGFKF